MKQILYTLGLHFDFHAKNPNWSVLIIFNILQDNILFLSEIIYVPHVSELNLDGGYEYEASVKTDSVVIMFCFVLEIRLERLVHWAITMSKLIFFLLSLGSKY